MNQVSNEDFLALSKMLPEQRFDYALAKMIENGTLWGLYGENGWVMLNADDDACIPVWPHQEFAVAWVKDDFPDCEPKEIVFDEWLEMWLPGMKNNNTLILVFPLNEDEEGIMLEADEMLECIEDELKDIAAKNSSS